MHAEGPLTYTRGCRQACPALNLQKLQVRIARLPKAQQRFAMQMIVTVVEQQTTGH